MEQPFEPFPERPEDGAGWGNDRHRRVWSAEHLLRRRAAHSGDALEQFALGCADAPVGFEVGFRVATASSRRS